MTNKQKCDRCKMIFQKFHICLDFANLPPLKREPTPRQKTAAHREALARSARVRWDALNRPRNEKAVRYFLQGLTLREVGKKVGVSHTTVIKIIRDARDAGLLPPKEEPIKE